MEKDTSQLLQELENCTEFRLFFHENAGAMVDKTLSEYLAVLVEQHGIKKAEAIRKSELSEVYGYQIFSGLRVPERKKLLSLAVGMELSLEEVQTLLKCAGYATLYAKKAFDCVVIYGICRRLSVAEINDLLYDYGMDTLG